MEEKMKEEIKEIKKTGIDLLNTVLGIER